MPRLTEGGYDAGNDSDPVRGACNRPVHTHLYVLSLQKHEETGLSLCPVASVCADRVRLSNAVPAWRTVPVDILRDRISVCAAVCVRSGSLYSKAPREIHIYYKLIDKRSSAEQKAAWGANGNEKV